MRPVTTSCSGEDRPLRKDAERNRLRILDAAAELFAEEGLNASLDAVAARAGVGVGTVYRRFVDKEALIDALFEKRIEEVVAIAEEALTIEDPWTGLLWFFERSLDLHLHDRGLRELLFSTCHGRDRVAQGRERIKPVVSQVVQRAQAAGALRSDFDTTDVPVVQLMLTAVMEYTGDVADGSWRRCLGLVLDGMRADCAEREPLAPAPLTDTQLELVMARGLRPPPRR